MKVVELGQKLAEVLASNLVVRTVDGTAELRVGK